MCLNTVDKRIRARYVCRGTGIGFKFFESDNSYHLHFPFFGGRIKYDTWYIDKAVGRILQYGISSYPKGYHIFLTEKGAKSTWGEIRRVEYREVVASGKQHGHTVVVARELLIHKKGE